MELIDEIKNALRQTGWAAGGEWPAAHLIRFVIAAADAADAGRYFFRGGPWSEPPVKYGIMDHPRITERDL